MSDKPSNSSGGQAGPPGGQAGPSGGQAAPPNGLAGQLSGLAGPLVASGLLSAAAARAAQAGAVREKVPFVSYLVAHQHIDSRQLAEMASREFGVPLLNLAAVNRAAMPRRLVAAALVSKHHALPLFRRGGRLFVAVSDPTNLVALDEIKFHTGISTEAILADEGQLADAICEWESGGSEDDASERLDALEALGDLSDEGLEDLQVEAVEEEDRGGDRPELDEAPVVRFVNKVLLDAIRSGASDIHFEPYENSYRVRFRTDGILQEVARPPAHLAGRLAARIKVMSRMDIAERRIPQDGRMKMKLPAGRAAAGTGREQGARAGADANAGNDQRSRAGNEQASRAIDIRVNTLPLLFGEKICLRLLDPASARLGIDALGYEDAQKQLYLRALAQPQGMILATGPTGSGKSVSLYAGLNLLNTPERNISTAEDPVEIHLDGINQCHVNPKVGLSFAEALRSFLRQDPDVIMVGEIRDLETAEIAVKAAQTGHLVLSTLHTNSAAETVARLLNMGVAPFNLAASLSLIIAQRLARRLCAACKAPADIPRETLLRQGFTEAMLAAMPAGAALFQPVGCPQCADGYRGRVGIYEVVRITPALARLIMAEGDALRIAAQAREEGFNNLRMSALRKAASGETSLAEAERVTTD